MPFKSDVLERVQNNDPTLMTIARGAWTGTLREGDIKYLVSLIQTSKNRYLTSLDFSENAIGDAGALALSPLTTITHLQVFETGMTAKGAQYLSKINSLTWLDISLNPIGDEGFSFLVENSSLVKLEAYNCNITSEGALAVLKNARLTCLELTDNKIDNQTLERVNHRISSNKNSVSDTPAVSHPFWSQPVSENNKNPELSNQKNIETLVNTFNEHIKALNELLNDLPIEVCQPYPEYHSPLRKIELQNIYNYNKNQ